MLCKACGSEWKAGNGIRVRNCPFCGAPLQEEPRVFNTPEDALCEIVRTFGREILQDSQRLIGIFADLAPQQIGARRLLGYLAECDGPQKLIALRDCSPEERDRSVTLLVSRMKSELFVDEESARSICTAFLRAVFWNPEEELSEQNEPESRREDLNTPTEDPEKPQVPDPEVQPEAAPSPGMPELTVAPEPAAVPAPGQEPQPGADPDSGVPPEDWVWTGRMLLENDTEPDAQERAARLFSRAALRGDPEGQFRLAQCYEWGIGTEQNLNSMLYWYTKSAENDYADAQVALGLLYENGNGIPQDLVQAMQWYKRSADMRDPNGLFHLGCCYSAGIGCPVQPDLATDCFLDAVMQGSQEARKPLIRYYMTCQDLTRKDLIRIRDRIIPLALDDSDYDACLSLAMRLLRDPEFQPSGVRWIHNCAEKGNLAAIEWLAASYREGQYVHKDPKIAKIWQTRADQARGETKSGRGLFQRLFGSGN